jgi:hypothetical protein
METMISIGADPAPIKPDIFCFITAGRINFRRGPASVPIHIVDGLLPAHNKNFHLGKSPTYSVDQSDFPELPSKSPALSVDQHRSGTLSVW